MLRKIQIIIICLIYIVSLGFSGWFQNIIPMHFNSSGVITRYGSKFELLLLFPAIITVLFIISIIIEKLIKPKNKALKVLEYFRLYFLLLFGGMHIFFILYAI